MGAKKQTIGFRYYLGLLSGLCRGPVNEFVEIQAAEKVAWKGTITDNTLSFIDKPELFGGEKKEGGLQGPFSVFMGAPDQVLPGAQTYPGTTSALTKGVTKKLPDIKALIGTGLVSQFRGVVTVWFDGFVSAMNPYVKEWKFRVRRWDAGWWNDDPWYPEKALILMAGGKVKAMNAAHIIYECCTNPEWGRGLDASRMDDNAFTYAANTLCAEEFGVCLIWYRKEDVEVFIKKVCDLVGGVVYTDRETGLVVFRLVRDDYEIDDLPLFTPDSGLVDVRDDDAASADTSYNEIIGTGLDPITNQPFQMRAQNLASFQSQQDVSSLDQDYKGIPTKELLSRVVLRDLRANAVGLKRYNVVLDRRGWRIAPGMPFKISDPKRGIGVVVLRAGEIDDGNMLDGRINIKCVQDVFGLPETSFVTPVVSTWTPPPAEALPATEGRLVEASYRDIYLAAGSGDAEAAPIDAAYVGQLAVAPNASSYQYDLATQADGDDGFEVRSTGSFTGNAKLAANITPLQTEFEITDPSSFDEENLEQALFIEDELVRFDDYDEDTMTVTVTRGVGDTIPQSHPAGARLWTIDDDLVFDEREYTEGETVSSKVLTRTSSDVLEVSSAPTMTVELVARQGRPYPPADVEVDGESIYELVGPYAEPVITWAARNRITQGDVLIGHTEPTVAGEEGQEYVLRVYDGSTLLRTVGPVPDLTWTYTAALQAEDSAPDVVRVELESVRDGIASWQHYNFFLPVVGTLEDYLMIDGETVLIDGEGISYG